MRPFLQPAIVGLVGLGAGSAFAQMPAKQALDLAADVRWFGSHCQSYTVKWDELRRFMDRSGLVDPFAPDASVRAELDFHDKLLDAKAEYAGQRIFCRDMFQKYRATGLLREKTQDEIRRSDELRPDNSPAPNIFK